MQWLHGHVKTLIDRCRAGLIGDILSNLRWRESIENRWRLLVSRMPLTCAAHTCHAQDILPSVFWQTITVLNEHGLPRHYYLFYLFNSASQIMYVWSIFVLQITKLLLRRRVFFSNRKNTFKKGASPIAQWTLMSTFDNEIVDRRLSV